jgi:methionyl-tRNA formyltransferase
VAVRPEPPDDGRVRTVFLGSGSFAVPALRAIAAHPLVRLVGVVTAPARRAGRSQGWRVTPVEAAARAIGIEPVLTPPRLRHPDAISAILAVRPSLGVLADYGQIVPPPLLDLRHGALNLHPSALPRFRGAAPIPATILAGDRETAVTLMRMDAGLDTGPIVAQEPVALDGTERAPELEARLAELGAHLVARSLEGWLDGSLVARAQPEEGVVLTRPLRREDGRLDPSLPAATLERAVRAYDPWPGTFVELDGERLVVMAASVAPSTPGDRPGEIVREGRLPALATADGRLVLEQVTPDGRKLMSGDAWLRGRRGDG